MQAVIEARTNLALNMENDISRVSQRRKQAFNGAFALEARAGRAYHEGIRILKTAEQIASEARTMAAGAEAKVNWKNLTSTPHAVPYDVVPVGG